MKFTPQQYAQALWESISDTNPKDHDVVMDNFVKVLQQNGDLGKYAEIEQEFRKLKLESQGIKQAEVTVAREAEMNKGILDELNAAVGAGLGRPSKIEITTKVDESIIGGVVIKVDDTLIDASVKGHLDNLNQTLRQ